MEKDEVIEGFVVLDVVKLPEISSTGLYLKDKRTGLEVFHLLNDDAENLFAFSFRTPPADSTGVAHVLEHSVLCGSQKYPVKDPFIRLANQSVKTYLNAWTAPDRTVFPASSQMEKDYFNLFSVYADAVFFPLLRPEIFMQEAHHLEYDEKGDKSIQGVVYNEMKGVYSSFDSVAQDACQNAAVAGTPFECDSGGDPLDIPNLTLEKLRAFHKKYYCPANCMLFLYGNIPTRKQLSFLQRTVLSRIASGGKKSVVPLTFSDNRQQAVLHVYGPAAEQEEAESGQQSTVMVCWNTSRYDAHGLPSFERVMENAFLEDLLCGDDSAPVSKALLQSGLGQDIAPQTGSYTETRENTFMCGLRGVDKKNARKVERVVLDALGDICKNGIDESDFERTCMGFDFDNREIKRYNGPFSLIYLRRCLRGWLYGAAPWTDLLVAAQFEAIKKKFAADKTYLKRMIRTVLLDNAKRSLVVVTPSAKWSLMRLQAERKMINALFAGKKKESVIASLKSLHDFQEKHETEQEDNCIPHLGVKDLAIQTEKYHISRRTVRGISCFESREQTNGILYATVSFPADVLAPQEYPFVPLVAACVTETGWNNTNWEEALKLTGRTMGSFSAYGKVASYCSIPEERRELYHQRDWLTFAFKMMNGKIAESFSIVSDCITGTHFADTKRMKDILMSYRNDIVSAVAPAGHLYAATRVLRRTSRGAAVVELWDGIASLFTAEKTVHGQAEKTARTLDRLFTRMKQGGAVIHLTGDDEGLSLARKELPSFIKRTNLCPLAKKRSSSDEEFYRLTDIGASRRKCADEVFVIPGTVGFAATVLAGSPPEKKQYIHDTVFTRYLSKTALWEQIRTVGGAYGVMFEQEGPSKYAYFTTYRDPKPFNSLAVFEKCIKAAPAQTLSRDFVEKAVTGCYSVENQPHTPSARGGLGLSELLEGMTTAKKIRRMKWLISIKDKDLIASARRFSRQKVEFGTVVICAKSLISSKKSQKTGKIVQLPV